MLYFDHNATHPISRVAREAWLRATERYVGNPSSPHRLGARADAALDQARQEMAGWLGCRPGEIIWTSGATEGANTVLRHAAQKGGGEIWVSAIEHPCVIEAARRYFPEAFRLIPVTGAGVIDLGWLADALKEGVPALVAVMAANNETGVIQPWREALSLCEERGVAFFCDAAQWIGKMAAAGLGRCDYMIGCAHKAGGPQGVGFAKGPENLQPLIVGGPQENGRRAGTENVAGILAMSAALAEREAQWSDGGAAEREAMRVDFEVELSRALPGSEVIGAPSARLWNTVSAVMPEVPDCRHRWVVKLDKLGVAVSTGSACASGKERISHVLTAMGLKDRAAGRVLRFSGGWETRAEDWKALASALERAFEQLRD
jgi:cysteine desulfurase